MKFVPEKFIRRRIAPARGILEENEAESNRLIASGLIMSAIMGCLCCLLEAVGVFDVGKGFTGATLTAVAEMLFAVGVCRVAGADKPWLKTFLLLSYAMALAMLDSRLTYNTVLLMPLPVILSCRYFEPRLVIRTAVFTGALFALSAFIGAKGTALNVDTNFVDGNFGPVGNVMAMWFLPKLMLFAIISIVIYRIAKRGREMVQRQSLITRERARLTTELDLAGDIQRHMLPEAEKTFPGREEFIIRSFADPAREVGGDFYDFFMPDDRHLAFCIADVSGKGVPAALFMVVAKTLLREAVSQGLSPARALGNVNETLSRENRLCMFVSVFLGVLDLETGSFVWASGGHTPPLYGRAGEPFRYLKAKPCPVLGALPGVVYRQEEMTLSPGDRLFLYTDGVTEAMDREERLYGENRLLACANVAGEDANLCAAVQKSMADFTAGAEQSDDTTMLEVVFRQYKKRGAEDVKTFPADTEELDRVMDFIADTAKRGGCPGAVETPLRLMAEEIFVNVASYAYGDGTGDVTVKVRADEAETEMVFTDGGAAFDPLQKAEPDLTLGAEERPIGGLGIFLVRQLSDEVSYRREAGKNVLTVVKRYGAAEKPAEQTGLGPAENEG